MPRWLWQAGHHRQHKIVVVRPWALLDGARQRWWGEGFRETWERRWRPRNVPLQESRRHRNLDRHLARARRRASAVTCPIEPVQFTQRAEDVTPHAVRRRGRETLAQAALGERMFGARRG